MDAEERVQWIYASKTNDELIERYDEWAKSYDHDMIDTFGYTAPDDVPAVFVKYMRPEDRILDVGAGTGLVGLALYQQGYRHLVALDMSEAMLAEAARKQVYSDFKQGVLGQPLDLATDSFDGMISAGTFTLGHAPASAFQELTRITRAGGHIAFSLNSDLVDDYKKEFDALAADGRWTLIEVSERLHVIPKKEPEVSVQVFVYKVTC